MQWLRSETVSERPVFELQFCCLIMQLWASYLTYLRHFPPWKNGNNNCIEPWVLIIYYCVTNSTKLRGLKQHLSFSFWIGNLGAVYLGSMAQGLTGLESMHQLWLQSSQGPHKEESASKCNRMIIVWLLVGLSFSRDVGPRASVTPWLLTRGHLQFLVMWASPGGLTSWNLLHQSSEQEEPHSKCKQDRSHSLLSSLGTDITSLLKETKLQLLFRFHQFFHVCSSVPVTIQDVTLHLVVMSL